MRTLDDRAAAAELFGSYRRIRELVSTVNGGGEKGGREGGRHGFCVLKRRETQGGGWDNWNTAPPPPPPPPFPFLPPDLTRKMSELCRKLSSGTSELGGGKNMDEN